MHKTPARTKILYLILKPYAQRKLRAQVRNASTEPPDCIGIYQYSHSEDRQRPARTGHSVALVSPFNETERHTANDQITHVLPSNDL